MSVKRKSFDIKRPKDKVGLMIVTFMMVILFFAIRPTYQLYTDIQQMQKSEISTSGEEQLHIEQIKLRMQAINGILNKQTISDSTAWVNQVLDNVTKATAVFPVQVTTLKAPYHVTQYGYNSINEELVLKGSFKNLNQVIKNLEENIPGRINVVRIEEERQNIEGEKIMNLYIYVSAVLKINDRN